MSEETTQESTSTNVNKILTLQERVNSAYIANDYTLLNGGTDNIVMIQGSKEGLGSVDIMLTYDGLKEVIESLKVDTEPKAQEEESKQE